MQASHLKSLAPHLMIFFGHCLLVYDDLNFLNATAKFPSARPKFPQRHTLSLGPNQEVEDKVGRKIGNPLLVPVPYESVCPSFGRSVGRSVHNFPKRAGSFTSYQEIRTPSTLFYCRCSYYFAFISCLSIGHFEFVLYVYLSFKKSLPINLMLSVHICVCVCVCLPLPAGSQTPLFR